MGEQKEKQNEDDASRNVRPLRRGPNRVRRINKLPEPDNVLTPPLPPSEGAQFRAMAIQQSGPQLDVQSATPGSVKTATIFPPPEQQKKKLAQLQLSQKKNLEEEEKSVQQLVVNTESRPCFSWDISKIQIQNLPLYFPRDMLQWERFPLKDLPQVLERISSQFRESSVQASLIHEPLSAKLQTCHDNVELYLVFFRESMMSGDDDDVSMSVQRHKGDHMIASRFIQHLVDAAKGIQVEGNDEHGTMDTNTAVTADAALAMERLIERCVKGNASAQNQNNQQDDHPFFNQTPDQMTESAVRDVYGWLEQCRRLDLRRQGLECLLAMTNLKRTLSSQAIAGSLVVLQGKVVSNEISAAAESTSVKLDFQARTIQSILLSVLLNKELPGDRSMLLEGATSNSKSNDSGNRNNGTNLDLRPYFPDDEIATNSADLPEYYTEYMNDLFHLALRILVQSLEVVACFSYSTVGGNVLNVGEGITKQLLTTASDIANGSDLYHTLLGCVGRAETKLANGYLACKALRLLALDHPGIKEQIKFDGNAKQHIGRAYQVGQVRHTLLEDESYQLWQTVCGH